MKINTDKQTSAGISQYYTEIGQHSLILDDIQIGEKIKIIGIDTAGKETIYKEFTAKYINCHINCQWQDKGTKQEIQP